MKQLKAQLPLLCLLLLAAVSIFYQFNRMPPPYPWADEAGVGYEANLTLAAGPRMLNPAPLGAVHDPHYAVTVVTVFLAAMLFNFTGPSLALLRLISGLMGLVSVAAVYFLVREMFRASKGERAHIVGLAAGSLMAVSLWFLGMTRLGWAPPAALMLGTIFCYFFWKALNTRRQRDFALVGLFLALAQYGHITARFLPFAVAGFLALNWLAGLLARRLSDSLLWQRRRGWLILATVCLLGCLPIFQYYWRFPQDFFTRARLISPAFAPTLSLSQRLLEAISGPLNQLSVLGFDGAWLLFRDATALLSPLDSLLFWGGMGLLLWRWRSPQSQFLLMSWLALSAPAWLTSRGDISFLAIYDYARRAILALPPTYIIAGLLLVEAAVFVQNGLKRVNGGKIKPEPAVVLVVGLILLNGAYHYYAYFGKWQNDPYLKQVFLPRFLPAVEKLETLAEPDSIFIFPINAQKDTTERPDLYTIGFLYQGQASFAVVSNQEAGLTPTLTALTRGRTTAYLLQAAAEDDPKQAIPWRLAALGQPQPAAPEAPGYQVSMFRLNAAGQHDLESAAVGLPFGQTAQLTAYAYGSNLTPQGLTSRQVESAGTLLVKLGWKLLAEGAPDYNTALLLRDAHERVVAQADAPLVNAAGQTSGQWPAQAEEQIYLTWPLPVGLAPGDYWLDVVLYDAATLRRQAPPEAQGDLSYRLGTLTVWPVSDPARLMDRLAALPGSPVELTPALRLAGSSFQTDRPLLTGTSLQGVIYWQALAPPEDNLAADYVLVSTAGTASPLAQAVPLGGADYPASHWRTNEIVADYLSLSIPPTTAGGKYWLGLRLSGSAGQTLQETPLAEVTVESWERSFELPAEVRPLSWQVGDSLKLVGARWPETASPGEPLPVQLFWQAEQESQSQLIAFVHLLDETGKLVSQHDSAPGQGQRPVAGWQKQEIVADTHELQLPAEMMPGRYRLIAGMYEANSGQRLPALRLPDGDRKDVIALGQVEIR